MRKFSTLIAVTLMVSLAACGGSSKKPGTTTAPTTGGPCKYSGKDMVKIGRAHV